MGTVNFSVPDDVKDRFDKAFSKQNKSRIIAALMLRAIEEQALRKRRARALDALAARLPQRRPATMSRIRKARESGRP